MKDTGGPFSISITMKSVRYGSKTDRGMTLRTTAHRAQSTFSSGVGFSFKPTRGVHNPSLTVELNEASDGGSVETALTVSGSFLVEALIAGIENGTFVLSDDQRSRLFSHFRPRDASSHA